ncbi:MAG: hypothetical protein QXS54_07925 [Candidatus Methanomethylicaceae archaeon]
MDKLISQIVYRSVARKCDDTPAKSLEEIWRLCRRQLIEMGLSEERIDDLNINQDLRPHFDQRLVPNPRYWLEYFQSKVCFYLVRCQSRRYHSLLSLLKQYLPGISFFVCYGELDVIVRIFGDDQLIEQVEKWLTGNGFSPTVIKIDEVVLFYDQKVDLSRPLRRPNLDPNAVDQALASRYDEITSDVVNELLNSGVALGVVYFEDTHRTGRIRAFVGMKFDNLITAAQQRRIEQALLHLNDESHRRLGSRPLSSIYRCGGAHYAYLLEMIVDDQEELDWITDHIQELDPNIGDTETLILAKASFSPVSYSQRRRGLPGQYAALREVFDHTLLPLAQSLIRAFPSLEASLTEASPEQQFRALSIYYDLVEKSPYPRISELPLVRDHQCEFLRGVLEGNSLVLQNAGLSFIRDVLERQHRELIKDLLAHFFRNNEGEMQKVFKAEDSRWHQWGLAKWANYRYPNWNQHRVYGAILQVPDDVLRSLALVGQTRNRLAHETQIVEFATLTQQVREVFYHGYCILSWLQTAEAIIRRPYVPLSVVREIISFGPDDPIFSILSEVRVKQDEMVGLLKSLRRSSDESAQSLANLLEEVRSGVRAIDDRTLSVFEEVVIPRIRDREKGSAQRLLSFLKESASALPSDVIANILASLIVLYFPPS